MQDALAPLGLLGLCLVACLPISPLRTAVLFVYGWGLRCLVAASLASLGFFLFQPEMTPAALSQCLSQVFGEGLGITQLAWQLVAFGAALTAACLPVISLCDAGRIAMADIVLAAPQSQKQRHTGRGAEGGKQKVGDDAKGKAIRPADKSQSVLGGMTGGRRKRLGDLID